MDSSETTLADLPESTRVAVRLRAGGVLPAHPLALTERRCLDERYQRGLSRYYLDSGAIGLAVGVHTTQFEIRQHGLHRDVLTLAKEELDQFADRHPDKPPVRVAGICGATQQAVAEALVARELGYHYGLLNLGALSTATPQELLVHCRAVAEAIDLFGFYLQPAVGGIELPYSFWASFCEIDAVAAIKIAAFDRYRTLDVIRAVVDSGRDDIALYTGNDDNIIHDLVTTYRLHGNDSQHAVRFCGGLLGQWAVWTSKAVQLDARCRLQALDDSIPRDLLGLGAQLTDANSAIFDVANQFRGCIAGIHEILWRQGLLRGTWCLDPQASLSPGQAAQIDRVLAAYPHLTDDPYVTQNRENWLSG